MSVVWFSFSFVCCRRVHTSAISNTWWMRYFIFICLESLLSVARAMCSLPGATTDVILFYAEVCLLSWHGGHCVTVDVCVCLAVVTVHCARHLHALRYMVGGLQGIIGSVALALLYIAIDYQIRYRSQPAHDSLNKGTVNSGPESKLLLRSATSPFAEHETHHRRARVCHVVVGVALIVNIAAMFVDVRCASFNCSYSRVSMRLD